MGRTLIHCVIVAVMLAATACAAKAPRSPERLRDTYVESLSGQDAAQAYALLSPELRAEVSFEDFERRWKQNATERRSLAEAGKSLAKGSRAAVRGGTTALASGELLTWTAVADRYFIVEGLPGAPTTATPGQTIRALIAAVRTTDLSAIRGLLGDDLSAAIDEDWSARVEAMEAALDRPGSIELSSDLRRAELSYEPGRVLTLEQTQHGWRITSLE